MPIGTKDRSMPTIKGMPVAPGLAIGPVHVVRARADSVPVFTIRSEEVDGEVERLHDAVRVATELLMRQEEIVREGTSEKDAGILAVHRMILKDPTALKAVDERIRNERLNAEAAVQELIDRLHATLGKLEGNSVRRYAEDVSEPWRVVLDVLLQRDREQISATEERVVLAAIELTPQVVTFIERERVLAIVTETGGRFSHGAVLARAFGMPCVVECPNLLARLEQNMSVLVDGDAGTIQLDPDQDSIDRFLDRRKRRNARRKALAIHAELPAVTPDGQRIGVSVNMESIRDIGTFEVDHCDGIGLLRTEFLYMERPQFPSEEEQFRLYRRIVDSMEGRPVTMRALDIGGDKRLPYFETPQELNPALGWRGLRVTLKVQDLLIAQLRAVLRASAYGNVRLLLPMVTSLDEVRAVREILDGVRRQLLDQGYDVGDGVPLGCMIEVPSSIWILDHLVQEVDFVSVGTNDLVQYILAVDRDNSFVSDLYEPHHPAVIRALSEIARITNAANTPCSVCGEIAGDYPMALLLLGMGFDDLSVAPNFLAEIRYAVRQTPSDLARALAEQALMLDSPAAIRELLAQERERLHRLELQSRAEIAGGEREA
jgi:phosphotransferase system enzyme I (PtsI)